MQIEDKDIKQKNCVIFFPSNLVRWWSNFPLMFSADLGRWKVGNLSPLIISAAWPT